MAGPWSASPNRNATSGATPYAEIGEDLVGLHWNVCRGDAVAAESVASLVLPRLRRRLRLAFRRVPADVLVDGAVDAIVEYLQRPARFDSSRGVPLDRFLYHAASRNVLDAIRSASSRRARELRYEQEMVAAARDAVSASESARDATQICERHVARLFECTPEWEQRALRCWVAGDRQTDALAVALGFGTLPSVDRQREVKRFKDRILRRLRRIAFPTINRSVRSR